MSGGRGEERRQPGRLARRVRHLAVVAAGVGVVLAVREALFRRNDGSPPGGAGDPDPSHTPSNDERHTSGGPGFTRR